MNAIILCASLGSRLGPISREIPKPLLPIIDRPIIDLVIGRIKACGAERIGINLFYRAAEIAEHLSGTKGLEIVVEKTLTDTGGPLLNFPRLLKRDVIVHNCDVLSDFDLLRCVRHHHDRRAVATLLLTRHEGTDLVETSEGRIVKFHRREKAGFLTYCGICILGPGIGRYFPKGKRAFSIKEALSAAIADGQRVIGLRAEGEWYDIGTPFAYWKVHQDLLTGKTGLPLLARVAGGKYVADPSLVQTEHISGFCSIGPGCRIARDVRLMDSIVLPGTRVDRGRFRSAIVFDETSIKVK